VVEVFNDPALDAYEQQLLQANQSLVAARDRLDQARSLARVATADCSRSFQRIPARCGSAVPAIVR
jgi:outer membrane protein TolC